MLDDEDTKSDASYIVAQVWCKDHGWKDMWFNPLDDAYECYACGEQDRARMAGTAAQRAADMAALDAWSRGLPL